MTRLIRDTLSSAGSDSRFGLPQRAARQVLDFANQQLFAPLGMRTAVLSFDATETPAGSSLFLASALDWARFGMLYLRDGVMA